ncbi:MAG TPA: Uma2 family endonuclease [Candidatus Ozemobacteraceae bacterium]|nr:Uma2 family endonuclease [Candidatus Ozemobacteraceae bacterium]
MSDSRRIRKKETYTYGDYLTWPDDERWEIIDGEAYNMTPAPTPLHQEISGNLFGLFWNQLRDKPCKVFTAPFDVRLPDEDEASEDVRTVVQPDILVVCDETKIDPRGLRGAPDIVIEILSPTSASRDHILKRRIYERHGVKEYWLIDPVNRIVSVYHATADGCFGNHEVYNDEAKIHTTVLPGLTIDMSEVFPRLPKKIVRESPRKYQA